MDPMITVMEGTADLTSLGTVFTQLMTWVGNLVTTISDKPLLLISVGIFVAGAVIGLGRRLIRG